MEICIVASRKREPLITKYLEPGSYKISYTPDYALPMGFKPHPTQFLSQNELGACRCFRGHQGAIKMIEGDCALIIEDDAVPNVENWMMIVNIAEGLLDSYQIISLHGRRIEGITGSIGMDGMNFKLLKPVEKKHPIVNQTIKLKWCIGSLAYLIRRDAMDRFLNTEYFGMGVDLFIANHFNFCVIETSPFDHDRRLGSLVEKAK